MVILVVGGDQFTLSKLASVLSDDVQIPVVIVSGSGQIADMLAHMHTAMQTRFVYKILEMQK